MTDKEKEAYNFFKKCNEKDLENFDYFSEPSKLQIKYMETVLNLIQTQQKEIERLKCNNEILQGELDRIGAETLKLEAGSSTDDVIAEIEKKDKIIDEMAKSLLVKEIGTNHCGYDKEYSCIKSKEDYRDINCRICIKEYFINKVEKENKDE